MLEMVINRVEELANKRLAYIEELEQALTTKRDARLEVAKELATIKSDLNETIAMRDAEKEKVSQLSN